MNIPPAFWPYLKSFTEGFIGGVTGVLTGVSLSQSVDSGQVQVVALNYKTILVAGVVGGLTSVKSLLREKPVADAGKVVQ